MSVVVAILYGLLIASIIVLALYALCWVSLLIHEAGHLIAARTVDAKVDSVNLGSGPLLRAFSLGSVRYEVRWQPFCGSVNIEEGIFAYSTRQLSVAVLGGPIATLLLASVLTWIFYSQLRGQPAYIPGFSEVDVYARVSEFEAIIRVALTAIPKMLVVSTWATLIGCFIPMRMASGIPTDGLQLWWLWFPDWKRKAFLERIWKKPQRPQN